MGQLPLDLINTFIVFSESRNIIEAAKRLKLSQPAVSVQLKKLESLLPYPVFQFRGKKKILSKYGRSLYLATQDKLKSIETGLSRLNLLYADPGNIEIRVGTRKEIFSRVAAHLKFSGKVTFVDLSGEESIAKLSNGEIDAAITHEKPDSHQIIARTLFREGVRLHIPKKFLRGIRSRADIIDNKQFLRSTPCLLYKENPPFFDRWIKHLGISIQQLNVRCICDDWNAIARMVEVGMGISIIPEGIYIEKTNVFSVEIPDSIIPKMSFFLLYSADLRQIVEVRELVQIN